MLDHYYRDPKCLEEKRQNYLAIYLHEMADVFHQQGRSYLPGRHAISLVAQFGSWLHEIGRKIREVTPEDAELFLAQRYPGVNAASSKQSQETLIKERVPINRVMRMIREKHPIRKKLTAVDKSVAAVAEHLSANRGLAPTTIQHYCYQVRRFLEIRFGDGPVRPAGIKPMDVHDYARITGVVRGTLPPLCRRQRQVLGFPAIAG